MARRKHYYKTPGNAGVNDRYWNNHGSSYQRITLDLMRPYHSLIDGSWPKSGICGGEVSIMNLGWVCAQSGHLPVSAQRKVNTV